MCYFENVSIPLVELGLVDVVDADGDYFEASISETILNWSLMIGYKTCAKCIFEKQ